jgi:hypothetical protein
MMIKLYASLCLAVCILFTFPGFCIGKDQEAALKVKRIIFTIDKDGREKIALMCNQVCIPDLFTIEGKHPRVVMDLKEVSSTEAGHRTVHTRGKFVKRIRSYLDKESKRLRVVLDMGSAKYYIVHPMQSESDNIYFLNISERKPAGNLYAQNSLPSQNKQIAILRPDLMSVEKDVKSKGKEDKPNQVGDVRIANDEISVNQGRSQMNAGDFTGAVETFTQRVAAHPQDSLGYRLRGNAYDNLGDRRKAIEDWITAARLGDEIIRSYLDFLQVKWQEKSAP